MTFERTPRLSRRAAAFGALTVPLSLSVCFPVPAAAQTAAPAAPKSTVYTNPRSGPDDPRIGLKAGLYDAGEAAFGLERLVSLPKPPGFAPDNFIPNPEQPGQPEPAAP